MEKERDFLLIYPWMTELFKKQGSGVDYIKRDIFAYIWSFSRDGKSEWYGKQQKLAEMVGCSEKIVCVKLKELVDDGYITKTSEIVYGMIKNNHYKVNFDKVYPQETAMEREETAVTSQETRNLPTGNCAVYPEETKHNIDHSTSYSIYNTTTIASEVERQFDEDGFSPALAAQDAALAAEEKKTNRAEPTAPININDPNMRFSTNSNPYVKLSKPERDQLKNELGEYYLPTIEALNKFNETHPGHNFAPGIDGFRRYVSKYGYSKPKKEEHRTVQI